MYRPLSIQVYIITAITNDRVSNRQMTATNAEGAVRAAGPLKRLISPLVSPPVYDFWVQKLVRSLMEFHNPILPADILTPT